MCARYTLTAEEKELIKQGNYTLRGPYSPDSNIAITDVGFVVTTEEPDVVQRMFWGIVPADAESNVPTFASFNIRSEDVLSTYNFAKLLKEGKVCIIFADGFYEAEEVAEDDKRPWRFITERKIFAFLGLWSERIDPISGEIHRTYGIFTCKANKVVGQIHPYDRMPVILSKADEDFVLHKKPTIEQLLALCVPYPDSKMNRYRVSKKALAVSTKAKPNKGKDLIDEVPDEPRQTNLFGAEEIPAKPKERKFKNTAKPKLPKKENGGGNLDMFNSL
ncbi:SOS response-associated peptidase [Pedobacter sp. PWIIR3]